MERGRGRGTEERGRKRRLRKARRQRKQTGAGRRSFPQGPSGASLAKCEPPAQRSVSGRWLALSEARRSWEKKAATKIKIQIWAWP